MPNPFRRSVSLEVGSLIPAILLYLLSFTASRAMAQSATPPKGLDKQLSRIDLAVNIAGSFTSSVSGNEQRDRTPLNISGSSTVGEVFTLRYIAKPFVGFELNLGNARYTQNFIFGLPTQNYLPGGAQADVREETLGYVAHTRPIFGLQPYLGAGGGTIRFKPTRFGGQGLPQQYRAAYYYNGGVEDYFPTTHLGVRVGFRQLIYLAPDFGQNYLTITRRARTSEPTFGFFLRF